MGTDSQEPRQSGSSETTTGFLGIRQERLNGFTYRAMRSLRAARDEAVALQHGHIAPEHLLLGVLALEEGAGAIALSNLGIDLPALRAKLVSERAAGSTSRDVTDIRLTPRADGVLDLTAAEAKRLGHDHIGTEHILLGLLSDRDGVVASHLRSLGVDLDSARSEVTSVLSQWDPQQMRPGRGVAEGG